MLDVRRLRVFREVARHGSLSAAADALSYTTSAVSQHVAALEREVGIALVERRPRGVQLTAAGTLLIEHTAVVLRDLDAAEAALAELVELRRGTLRIASFATAGATILPRAVDAFRAQHPGVDVTVVQATAADGVERVREGRIDVALTVDQEPAPGLELVDLFMDPFRLAVHRTHPLAAVEAPRIAQLAGETWIDVPEGAAGGGLLAAVCDAAGIDHRVAFESDDYGAINEMVGARLGIALLPDLALLVDHADVVLRTLGDVTPTRRIQAATKPAAVRAPAAGPMLAILAGIEPRRRVPQPATASGPSR